MTLMTCHVVRNGVILTELKWMTDLIELAMPDVNNNYVMYKQREEEVLVI
jgi:hypothetical protein